MSGLKSCTEEQDGYVHVRVNDDSTSSVPTEDMSSSVSGSSDEDSEMSLSLLTVEHASEDKVVAKPSMSQMKKNTIDWIKTLLLVDGDNMRAALQSHEDSLERAAINAGIPVVRITDHTSGVTCTHFTKNPVNTDVLSLRVRKADKQMKGVGEQTSSVPTEDMSSSVSGSSDEGSEMSLSIKTVEHASEDKVVAKPSMSQMKKNSIDCIKTLLLVDADNMRAALQSHEDS